nr:ATPase [Cytophagales bacterium]
MKPIFQSPDQRLAFFRKVFAVNRQTIQAISLVLFALTIYDLGYNRPVQPDLVGVFVATLLLLLVVGYSLKLVSRSEKYTTSGYIGEIGLLLLLLTAFLVQTGTLPFSEEDSLSIVSKQAFLVDLIVFVIFLVELSKVSLSVNRLKIHPAVIFMMSFLIVIIIGMVLLLLPNATVRGISVIDALFTSTSAVCVTGLIVLDTSSDFTFLGQIIILVLFQVGGLGMMTFTSFFGFFFKGSYSLQNQLFLRDFISENNINAVNSTVVKIILFTLIVEATAAVLIFLLVDTSLFQTPGAHVFFAIFHAVSGFCNAGFSILRDGLYQEEFRHLYTMQLVIAATIVLGGIGFPVVVAYFNYLRHVWIGTTKHIFGVEAYKHAPRVVNVNVRLIMYTTVILLLVGFVSYLIFEQNHTLQGLSWYGKFVTAIFGSVTPRTAGFNTVDMGAMAMPTVLIYLILMWIGASPGSTGGGLKTSTFAVAVLNAVSIAKGKDRLEVFSRQIENQTLRKAFAVILLSFLIIGLGVFFVIILNPELELIAVAFEIFSAFSTVGLSLGITGQLSAGSKLVVIIIMFLGRVGTLTVLVAFVRKARNLRYKFPEESVFIT